LGFGHLNCGSLEGLGNAPGLGVGNFPSLGNLMSGGYQNLFSIFSTYYIYLKI
jgi:hypothetical protein